MLQLYGILASRCRLLRELTSAQGQLLKPALCQQPRLGNSMYWSWFVYLFRINKQKVKLWWYLISTSTEGTLAASHRTLLHRNWPKTYDAHSTEATFKPQRK